MPWTKIDDRFHDHPKVIAAGSEGVALFILSLSWCGGSLTDGFIPEAQVRRLSLSDNSSVIAERLVEVGLWERRNGGYQVHDYLDYNPSAVQVKAQREKYTRKQQLYDDPFLTRRVKARDGDGCRYCGIEVKWHDRKSASGGTYDHVDPEGPNSEANLVVACRGCNSKKGRRTPEEAGMPLLPLNETESSSKPDNNQNGNQNNSTIPVPVPVPVPIPEPAETDSPATPAAQAPALTPPATKPRKPHKKPRKPTPEAIRVFRENAHRYPAKAWYADVEQAIGDDPSDLELWGQIVKAYVGQGWNPTNVANMLEFYQRREIPGDKHRNDGKDPPHAGILEWMESKGVVLEAQ